MAKLKRLDEIKNIFNGNVPLIFRVMEDEKLLVSYLPLIKDAMVEDNGIQDQRVKEGLMVTFSTQCNNSYCFVSHSYILYNLGFSIENIKDMINQLRFPDQVHDFEKWSSVLRWSFLFSRSYLGPDKGPTIPEKFIQKQTSSDEFRHIFKILNLIDILNRFSEFYADKIKIMREKMFLDPSGELKLPIPDLVKYYNKLSNNIENPVVSICMYCKNIRDSEGKWHALESVLSALESNSRFSHGICTSCFKKVKANYE